jgi:hypothetical protein
MATTFTHEDLDWLDRVAVFGILDNGDLEITLESLAGLESMLNAVLRVVREAQARNG